MVVVAIPSMDDKCLTSQVSEHFRSSPFFTLVETRDGQIVNCKSVKNEERVSPPVLFRANEVTVTLVDRIGSGQLRLMNKIGVRVFGGASNDVISSINLYLEGKLDVVETAPSCSGHCAD